MKAKMNEKQSLILKRTLIREISEHLIFIRQFLNPQEHKKRKLLQNFNVIIYNLLHRRIIYI